MFTLNQKYQNPYITNFELLIQKNETNQRPHARARMYIYYTGRGFYPSNRLGTVTHNVNESGCTKVKPWIQVGTNPQCSTNPLQTINK